MLAEGVEPEIDILQNIPAGSLPWWTERILLGQPIVLNSLDELKEKASAEYDILSKQNINRCLSFLSSREIEFGDIWALTW